MEMMAEGCWVTLNKLVFGNNSRIVELIITMAQAYEETSPQIQHSAICVYIWLPKAHLHTNSCCGFDARPRCSDRVGRLSNVMCFSDNRVTWECKVRVDSFYGWIRSSQQRDQWEKEKDSWSLRVHAALEDSNIIHACHAIAPVYRT